MSKILIVDDDPFCRELIAQGLQKVGYETLQANTPSSALDILTTDEEVDLLIVDVRMPEMDGLDLLGFVRNTPTRGAIPVLICSAVARKEAVIRARRFNVAGYLLKPIDIPKLRRKIQEVFTGPGNPLADLDRVLSRLDIDRQEYFRVLERYCDDLSAKANEMVDCMIRQDYEFIANATMVLSGAAQNLGTDRILDRLLKVSQACAKDDFGAINSLIVDLQREITQLRAAIRMSGADDPGTCGTNDQTISNYAEDLEWTKEMLDEAFGWTDESSAVSSED